MTSQKYINMSSPDIQYNTILIFIVATEKKIEMNSQGKYTVWYFQYNYNCKFLHWSLIDPHT